MIGGAVGLAGAMVIGPRIGKFNKDGSANTIPGHNITIGYSGNDHPVLRLVRFQSRFFAWFHRRLPQPGCDRRRQYTTGGRCWWYVPP